MSLSNLALDAPRSLKSDDIISGRKNLLSQPHMAALTTYVANLRLLGLGRIPDFDPLDGGINASILFLFEKPGPKALQFISRNNNDPTAENTFKFMNEAGIERSLTATWNVIPGWNDTIDVERDEIANGSNQLPELLGLFPHLKVIVAVGRRAEKALSKMNLSKVPIISSTHPSNRNRNNPATKDRWKAIPEQWAKSLEYL